MVVDPSRFPGAYETPVSWQTSVISPAKRSFAHVTALFIAVGNTDNRINWGERLHFFFCLCTFLTDESEFHKSLACIYEDFWPPLMNHLRFGISSKYAKLLRDRAPQKNQKRKYLKYPYLLIGKHIQLSCIKLIFNRTEERGHLDSNLFKDSYVTVAQFTWYLSCQ